MPKAKHSMESGKLFDPLVPRICTNISLLFYKKDYFLYAVSILTHTCIRLSRGKIQLLLKKLRVEINSCLSVSSQFCWIPLSIVLLIHLPFKILFTEKGNQLTEHDIDLSLVKDFLRDIGSKIQHQDLTSPLQLYENMRLVKNLGDKEQKGRLCKRLVPRNVALLFFNRTPEQFFPGAKTDIALYDQDKNFLQCEKLEGPIDDQINRTLEYILSETKHKEEGSVVQGS